MDFLLERRRMMIEQGEAVPVFYDFVRPSGAGAEVDTGVLLPSLCSIEVQAYATANFGRRGIVGANDGDGGITHITLQTSGGARNWQCVYDGGSAGSRNGGSLNARIYCCLTPYRFFGSMSSTNLTKGSVAPTTTLRIFKFGSFTETAASLAVGPVYIYGEDAKNATSRTALEEFTPVASFLPCTFKGNAGFWYVEEDRFIGNIGTGTLSAFNI